jgi:hypothetical protein
MYNPTWDRQGAGVVISNNSTQLCRRIGIEIQGCGRGGCNGIFVPLDGPVVSGNFIYNPVLIANSTWPSSLLLGASNSRIINNTMTLNTVGTSCYDHAYGIEGGIRGAYQRQRCYLNSGRSVTDPPIKCAGPIFPTVIESEQMSRRFIRYQ